MENIERLKNEIARLQKELTKARREYRLGFLCGQRLQAKGRDIGRGSAFWWKRSSDWHEGYEAGWKKGPELEPCLICGELKPEGKPCENALCAVGPDPELVAEMIDECQEEAIAEDLQRFPKAEIQRFRWPS